MWLPFSQMSGSRDMNSQDPHKSVHRKSLNNTLSFIFKITFPSLPGFCYKCAAALEVVRFQMQVGHSLAPSLDLAAIVFCHSVLWAQPFWQNPSPLCACPQTSPCRASFLLRNSTCWDKLLEGNAPHVPFQ